MKYIYDCKPVFFLASRYWMGVGHSYLVYAQMINGSTTIMYEGLPTIPDAGYGGRLLKNIKLQQCYLSTAIRFKNKNENFYKSTMHL